MSITDSLIQLACDSGELFRVDEPSQARQYFERMLEDGRIFAIKKESNVVMAICYSIGDDIEEFRKKAPWEYKSHNPQGSICFIEKMFSKKWNLWGFKEAMDYGIEEGLKKYPNVKEVAWQRVKKINGEFKALKVITLDERGENHGRRYYTV